MKNNLKQQDITVNTKNKIKKIAYFFKSRKESFAISLRYCIILFAVYSCIGIYFRSQAYISSSSFKSELYTIFMFLGLPGCLALLIGILSSLAALINKITMRVIGIILGVISVTFLLIDAVVFTQYKFHIDTTMLALFFSDAGTELISFSWSMFLMAAAGFLVVAAAICAIMYLAEKLNRAIFTKIAGVISIITVIGILIFHGWHAVITFQGEVAMVERNQIFPFNIGMTAKRLMRKLGMTPAEKTAIDTISGSFAYPKKELTFEKDAKKYNVIFVIVDSLRGDMINPEVMPFTSKIASENSYFKNHFSNGNCTRIGVFSLFSGLIGTYWQNAMSVEKGSVLVDSLLNRDYQTGVFFSAALTNPEFHRTIFSNVKNMTLKRQGIRKLERDNDAFNEFKNFIKKCDKNKPVLGILMYDALHGYEYPSNMKLKFPDAAKYMNYLTLRPKDREQRLKVFNLIRNATSFSDMQIQETIEFLKKELDWKKTIIVITSDHGNECNEAENNIWGHNSKFSQYQLHVPLILAGGPIEKGTFTHRTYHVDIVPTLMQLLKCNNDFADYSSGQSLYDKKERDMMIISSYSNRAMLYDDIIYEITKGGLNFNYDLKENEVQNPPSKDILKKYFEMISTFSR